MAEDKCRSPVDHDIVPNSQNAPRYPSFVRVILDFAMFLLLVAVKSPAVGCAAEPHIFGSSRGCVSSITGVRALPLIRTCRMGDPRAFSAAVMTASRVVKAVIYVWFQNRL